MTSDDRILSRNEASEWLHEQGEVYAMKPSTLAKLACVGGGPRMIKCGRRVGCRQSDLRQWADSRTRIVDSTSSEGAFL
jgi:predicted DNA-binding transcriptional regulator AlpA